MLTHRLLHLAATTLVWALPQSSWAQDVSVPDLDTACYFYPQGPGCEQVYQRALKDAGPVAISVRDAFEKYARYLQDQTGGLTQEDRRFLKENDIALPFALNASNQAGLHNVINDPALRDPVVRRSAVTRFIGHAVQAELYCSTTGCPHGAAQASDTHATTQSGAVQRSQKDRVPSGQEKSLGGYFSS